MFEKFSGVVEFEYGLINEQIVILIGIILVLINIVFVICKSTSNSKVIYQLCNVLKEEHQKLLFETEKCNENIRKYNIRMIGLECLKSAIKKSTNDIKLHDKVDLIHIEMLEDIEGSANYEKRLPNKKDYTGLNVYRFDNKKRIRDFKSKAMRELAIERNTISRTNEYIKEQMIVLDENWGSIENIFNVGLSNYPETIKVRLIKIVILLMYVRPNISSRDNIQELF